MIQNRVILLILIAPILMSSIMMHDYYFSLTDIEFVEEKKSVQCITKIFTDDLETMLRERYDESLTLDAGNDETEIDTYIEKYLRSKIGLKINEIEHDFVFIGKEYDDFSIYCYYEFTDIESIKSFEFKNEILFEIFNDQQNLIKTNINSRLESLNLSNENRSGIINYK